jgi:sarcosine oxidase
MAQEYDVIVLGLGAMGAATAMQSARRGAKVLGIDRFAPPHDQGSSHGDTRITRIACGEGPEYSAFALRSHEIWRELEAESGVELLTQNGLVVVYSPGTQSLSHGVPDFLATTVDAAKKNGVDHRILDTAGLRSLMPHFNFRDGDAAYYDRVSGFVRPERCIELQLAKARRLGAELHTNETVTGFTEEAGGVTVTTNKASYRGRQLVVAAGAWLPGLLDAKFAPAFKVTRQVLYWFKAKNADEHERYRPANMPVYIWQVPAPQVIYGFPAVDGFEHGVKIATEQDLVSTTPDRVDRTVCADETRSMYETYVAPFLPGLSPECVKAKVCLYTQIDRARFILDRHPGRERVIVASPCSGHGFKHSAGIGELLAEMALNGRAAPAAFAFPQL